MNIQHPFIVYVGSETIFRRVKTACGIVDWAPERCLSQLRDTPESYDLGLPEMSLTQAKEAGAKTLLLGFSPREVGSFSPRILSVCKEAIDLGLNIASGSHTKLEPVLLEAFGDLNGIEVYDFRHKPIDWIKGTGEPRSGYRILTFGTDCAAGKKFTALAIWKELQKQNYSTRFVATGQTGYLISGGGITNDTIPADFIVGALEQETPAAPSDHIDVIEGQGSILHPSFGGSTYSIIQGAQPDMMVACHDPSRTIINDTNTVIDVDETIRFNLQVARYSNPKARLGAISLFSRNLTQEAYEALRDDLHQQYGVPVFDPTRQPELLTAFVEADPFFNQQ